MRCPATSRELQLRAAGLSIGFRAMISLRYRAEIITSFASAYLRCILHSCRILVPLHAGAVTRRGTAARASHRIAAAVRQA
jgi:hypothetical protein